MSDSVQPQTAAHQASPSLGFSRQEHWSGLPFPSPMHESKKWKWSRSVVSDPQWPHGLPPSRLLRPWDFPGKSIGVGCHCLFCLGAWRVTISWFPLGPGVCITYSLVNSILQENWDKSLSSQQEVYVVKRIWPGKKVSLDFLHNTFLWQNLLRIFVFC